MAEMTYIIKIKKEYAASMIEDLKQVDAIEILEGSIPLWQQEESLRRLSEMKANSASALSEDEFFKALAE